jgi:hypothetical protein
MQGRGGILLAPWLKWQLCHAVDVRLQVPLVLVLLARQLQCQKRCAMGATGLGRGAACCGRLQTPLGCAPPCWLTASRRQRRS